MIVSIRLMRSLAALAVMSSLAACGGGGGGGNPPDSPPVNPPTNRSVGGTVTGLSGTGLVLRNNGGDNLAVAANGAFTFATSIADGGAYAVTVFAQPANPAQTCAVGNGTGAVAGSSVTNVTVTCAANTFTVSAVVSGLTGSGLKLSNGQDQVTVNANGTVAFGTAVSSGARYNVIVDAAPSSPVQRCTVTGGLGTVSNANVTVAIACVATFPTFAYSINQDDSTFSSQAIDATTGQLRTRFSAKTGARPVGTVMYKPGNGKQFSYVANQDSDNISVFALDPRSGAVDEVVGSPFATGGEEPTSLTLHPTHPFLYAPNTNGTTIAAFGIDANTGALTSIGTVATGTRPQAFQIEATGRFAYAATPDSAELYTYAIDQTTGALTEVAGSRVTIGASIGGLTLERNGRYLYLFNPTPGTISAYAINATTGVLTAIAGSPFTAGVNAAFAATHPNGKFIYVKYPVPNQDFASGLGVFAIDAASGALSQVAGSPFDATLNPLSLAFDPTGSYLYASHLLVATPAQSNVRTYTVNASTGALPPVAVSQTNTSLQPVSIDVDGSGKYLYATNLLNNQLTSYRINSGTGALSILSGSPANVGAAPTFVTVEEDTTPLQLKSKFVYSVDAAGDFIHTFSLDGNGMLAQSSAPAAAGSDPHGVTLDPKGRFAYVANTAGDSISIYNVDATTGALSEIVGSQVAAGDAPAYIAIEPSGRYAYVSAANSMNILQFTVDPVTGGLSSPVTTNVGQAVAVLKIAPNGKWLLVSSTSDTFLRVYAIDPAAGGLTLTNPSANTGGTVSSIAVDPSGKLAYVTGVVAGDGTLLTYSINSQTGALSPSGTFLNFPNNSPPQGVAFDPLGGFAFTADGVDADTVSVFRVDANGAFSFRGSVAAGTNPIAVATDYSGKFVCVVTGAGEVLTFAIDRDGQTLTPVDADTVTGISTSGGLTLSTHAE